MTVSANLCDFSSAKVIAQIEKFDPDPDRTHIRPFTIPVSTAFPTLNLKEMHDNLPKEIFEHRLIFSFNPFNPCTMQGIADVHLGL